MGASPPSHTRTMEPASFFGLVVADTFRVRSPEGAAAISATDWPWRWVTP